MRFMLFACFLAVGVQGSHLVNPLDLRYLRCEVKCWSIEVLLKDACVRMCLSDRELKPGKCPLISDVSVFESACLVACRTDHHCPGADKCCPHGCGVTCQEARGLEQNPGLPETPHNVSVLEKRRGRVVQVTWSGYLAPGDLLLYLVQERHNFGRRYSSARVTDWTPLYKTAHQYMFLKNRLRAGRWYQFRVAAVNENGTQGFSHHSPPFTLSAMPRPPGAPLNLVVESLWRQNGTLQADLRWEPPAFSDLPVQRYKVFWSRQLQGTSSTLVSLLMYHQSVPQDATRFRLRDLEPSSLYFIQVQAVSQFGKDRLKGDKADIFLNTANHKILTESADISGAEEHTHTTRIADLRVNHVYWNRAQLLARITWSSSDVTSGVKYAVTWWLGSCEEPSNDKGNEFKVQFAATTDEPHFDMSDLKFQCKYRVTVRDSTVSARNGQEVTLMFETPTCEELLKQGQHQLVCEVTSTIRQNTGLKERRRNEETSRQIEKPGPSSFSTSSTSIVTWSFLSLWLFSLMVF